MNLLIFITVIFFLGLVTSVPISEHRKLRNRPTHHEILQDYIRKRPVQYHEVYRRSPQGIKGHVAGTKEYNPPHPLQYKVTKGEYVCGNRICKLQPGEIPKGCNGICQYPVK